MKEQLKLDNGKYVVYNLDKELEELEAKLKDLRDIKVRIMNFILTNKEMIKWFTW